MRDGWGVYGVEGGKRKRKKAVHTQARRGGKRGRKGSSSFELRPSSSSSSFPLLAISPLPLSLCEPLCFSPPPLPHLISQGQLLLPLEKLFRERLDLKKWKRVKERGGEGRNSPGTTMEAPPAPLPRELLGGLVNSK